MQKLILTGLGILFSLSCFAQSCEITTVTNIDSNQVKTLASSPVMLLPSAKPSHYWQIMSVEAQSHYNGKANRVKVYTYLNSPAFPSWWSLILYDTADVLQKSTQTLNDYNLIDGAALYLTADSNTTGNSSLKVWVTYRLVSMTGATICDSTSAVSVNGGICTEIFHLNSSQIKTLNSSPITIIGAPAVGYYTKVLAVDADLNYAGTPYSGNTILSIFVADTTKNIGTNNTTLTDSRSTLRGFAIGSNSAELAVNAPVKITTQLGNTIAGNSDIDLYLTYKTIAIGQSSCTGTGNPLLDAVKDTIVNLISDTVDLQLNKINVLVSSGTCTNVTYRFPAGQDQDAVGIITTQDVLNAIVDAANNTGNITPKRILQLRDGYDITFRNLNGQWY